MTTSVSSKGQIVLPAELRKQDKIKPGDKFVVRRLKDGNYSLVRQKKKKKQQVRTNKGLVDWLLSCPVKGFFEPYDRSETTDTL